jgi:filamentous hemagglutinin family protein
MVPAFPTRRALLAGASVSALAVGAAMPAQAGGPRVFSQAWFAARVDSSTGHAAPGTQANTLAQVSQAQQNLATIASRLQAMEQAQVQAAGAAASAPSTVPDGLVIGGLQTAPGAAAGSSLWSGADLPTEATGGGRTTVTVTQTAPQAILTWQTFNVGAKTTLSFNQSAGGASANTWVALNRVEDPAANPTQILGDITAPGKVYIINANGIVFGAGSQINLGSLIASTADISNAQFTTGLYGAQSGTSFAPSFTGATPGSAVVVDPGAVITTPAPTSATQTGGYVMLFGGDVSNGGEIETPNGQTVLAAGQDFILRAGYSTTGNQTATVQGSQVATCEEANGVCSSKPTGAWANFTSGGDVTNTGLVVSDLGDITMAGHNVFQDGVALSTTSVNERGTIHLLTESDIAAGNVILEPGSVTTIAPDTSGATALDSQRESLIAQSATNNALRAEALANPANVPVLNDVSFVPDQLEESRVEIVTGGFVQFDDGSVTMAQGGQIAVQAGFRVWVGDGANLDVSGATGAVLPMSINSITVNIQGNELRDSPVNRDTGLISSANVSVDANTLVQVAAGTDGDPATRDYTPGGLLEVSGYVSTVGHTIQEWSAVGGSITLQSNRSVVTQPGATLNVAGGSVTVQGGNLPQSYLIGPGGTLYNVNTAPANVLYSGVYTPYTVSYQRFGGSDTYASAVAAPADIYQAGYTYGRDAGSVTVQAPSAVLEARIDAGVTNGTQQTGARPAVIPNGDPYQLAQSVVAQAGTLDIPGLDLAGNLIDSNVTVSGDYTPVADTLTPGGNLPASLHNSVQLSATQLSGEQLGGFIANAGTRTVSVTGPITLAQGGTISLAGASVTVDGNLSARGGRVSISDITEVNGVAVPLLPKKGSGGVTVDQGVTIDLRALWTNAITNAGTLAGEAFINGGTLAIDSAQALSVGPGTLFDVSSGGALLPGNKQDGGTGGSIALTGDDPNPSINATPQTDAVTLGATLRGYGVGGGGTLAITAPEVLIGGSATPGATDTLLLDPSTFQTGFHDYVINGDQGLTVAPGTAITVAEPVYTFYSPGSGSPVNAPTGTDPSAVFQLILPPTFSANGASGRLTQRQGASVEFLSNNEPGGFDFGGGDITLGAGATIAVDPLQSVRIEAYGQIADGADITATGGTVALINEQQNRLYQSGTLSATDGALALQIFVANGATIDVSGIAVTSSDPFGRPYGDVLAGGTIELGADPGVSANGAQNATDANIVIDQGAVLEANGAAATIDLLAGTTPQIAAEQSGGGQSGAGGGVPTDRVAVATNGGLIDLRSFAGIDIGGTLQALPGGAGAAGGTLALTLEDPLFSPVGSTPLSVPAALQIPRVLTISQAPQDPLAGLALSAGAPLPIAAYGQANISQQQLAAGGFGTLSVYSRDVIAFQGSVALSLPVAVSLNQGIIAVSPAAGTAAEGAPAPAIGTVTIAAPDVTINGAFDALSAQAGQVLASVNGPGWQSYDGATDATLTVDAALIDFSNQARFGVTASYTVTTSKVTSATYSAPGFSSLVFDSSGDIRFDPGAVSATSTTFQPTSITSPGDITFQAAQIYPTTGATAAVFAGYDQYAKSGKNIFTPYGTISVFGDGTDPAVPYSLGGTLLLYAGNIVQDGIIRAPEGQITLGDVGVATGFSASNDNAGTYNVLLGGGSITSVSLDGLTIPYGGTVDGVTYSYDGAAIGASGAFAAPSISLAGQEQTVQAGALLDLSGGGTISGAGFVTGRGGSTDVLTSPFLQFSGTGTVAAPTLSQQPVYAIVPGYASAYAPLSPVELSGTGGSVPGIGSQVTIGSGVPGVAPGTYTLLPSYYALLPGAARVQIDTGSYDSVPGVESLGAGSYLLNATTLVADTGIHPALPVQVVVTTAAGVQEDSQFDQETYSQFEIAQAAQFGTPRNILPEDGKTLNLWYSGTSAGVSAFTYAGTALFGAAPAAPGTTAIGYAGQATVGSNSATPEIEITADGATPTPGFVSIDASALDAIGAPRLIVGGTLQPSANVPAELTFIGQAGDVDIRAGAVLSAPEIFLVATSSGGSGAVTVDDGATLTTIGTGPAPFDTPSSGYYYNSFGYTLVALSNGLLTFTPVTSSPTDGPITINDGASLLSGGTLNFATTQGLSLGQNATYGAKYLSIDVNDINIVGTTSAPAAILPSGFTLTQEVLTTLLDGNPATGTPPLQTLVLTADSAVNFVGSIALDTTALQQFVLNTPAIYGYGTEGDTASLTTGTLYWNGVATTGNLGSSNANVAISAPPGGVVTGGPGTGSGSLVIDAQNIVLGTGPDTQPNDQLTLNRLIEGFGSVTLNAAGSISANDLGSLSVYQATTTYGAPGTGGALTLNTPLITGAAASVDAITVGGALTLASGSGAASTATSGALGAELDLSASSITDGSAILLNAGRLTMTTDATGTGITLTPTARIDLSGPAVTLVNQTEYTQGGSLVLTAAAGNVVAAAGSSIDVSSVGGAAGSIDVADLGGNADLAGTMTGTAAAGQSQGSFTLATATLPGFDALNASLDGGGFTGSRSFEIAGGDLTVDQTVTAHQVRISTDGGSLTVTGTIDASGAAPGSISLDAGGDLTIASGATLDAHGTVLQTDSTGAAIGAENRGLVSLTTAGGTLTLGTALIDVASADPAVLGQVILDAPRTSAGGVENGVAIAAAGPISILGAQSITLYGSRTYTATDANGTVQQSATGAPAGAVVMDQVNTDNTAFIDAAATNTGLAAQTAGLSAYGAAYSLQPAVIVQSSSGSAGNLTVAGDIDLSGYRYGPEAGTAPGAGLPGLLTLRASNNLTVNGSISDGFAPPPDIATPTPDDKGWLLYASDPAGQAVTLPNDAAPVTILNGSSFSTATSVPLNYALPINSATLAANVVFPTAVVTAKPYTVGSGGLTATGTISFTSGGTVTTYRPGQIVPGGTVIPAGATFGQGTVLPDPLPIAAGTVWPAGAPLSDFAQTSVSLKAPAGTSFTLDGGAYVPGGSSLIFPRGATSVSVRPTNSAGEQGYVYATASLLPAGSQSWSINLVAGANLGSADVLAVQPQSALANNAPAPGADAPGSLVLSDNHYTLSSFQPTVSFSVVRTGTGSLNLVAGGDVDQASLFGVYTAGTETTLGNGADAAFDPARATQSDGTILGKQYNRTNYNAVDLSQQASYPDGGGDVLVSAGGNVTGDVLSALSGVSSGILIGAATDNVGNWLWREGGSGLGQSSAYWINFGSYVLPLTPSGLPEAFIAQPVLTGFTGFGALGGGNLVVTAGGNVGEVTARAISPSIINSQAVVLAVASTGRVTSVATSSGTVTGGTETVTGGGTLSLTAGGAINPALLSASASNIGGTITDTRGDITVDAGQIGRIDLVYNNQNPTDPRAQDPFTTEYADSANGLTLEIGDGTASLYAMRDVVLTAAGDPGRSWEQALTAVSATAVPGATASTGGDTAFSLWTPTTAVSLFSAGGNLTPVTAADDTQVIATSGNAVGNDFPTDLRIVYPGTLNAVAASGSVYYGPQGGSTDTFSGYSLELAPSPVGELSLIAAGSIYGQGSANNQYAIDMSGAAYSVASIPNVYDPSYGALPINGAAPLVANYLQTTGSAGLANEIFAFEADTPTGNLHQNDTVPAMIYAATGDLVDVQFGEVLNYPLSSSAPVDTWYLAAKPAEIYAGDDIVASGTVPATTATGYSESALATFPNQRQLPDTNVLSSGNVLLNLSPTDISNVFAGQDILGSYFYVAGPGLLEVTAGRNIIETGATSGKGSLNFGDIKSVGPIFDITQANRDSGASIDIIDGAGSSGPDYTAFADLYFNNANQANLAIPLSAPANAGKVQQTYEDQLYAWMQANYGYTGPESGALAAFLALPSAAQSIFVQQVFFTELNASGAQESDPASLFYKSYARGKQAIGTLFPSQDAYSGSLTMDSGALTVAGGANGTESVNFDAGISTLFGGSIQILSPGGADTFGTTGGPAPGPSSGVITEGSGDINVYALGSVLLGQSRIFTTFGGNILIWSAEGDINAGQGAKTTVIVPPPLIAYDNYGDITLSSPVPSSGAGIATLAPIVGVPPGNVSLIAPQGTVDAGEAGIRVSGNLNIAAATVVNAANIQVGGKTTGNTAAVATNTAAASAAASAAGASTDAATSVAASATQPQTLTEQPSIITVQAIPDAGT